MYKLYIFNIYVCVSYSFSFYVFKKMLYFYFSLLVLYIYCIIENSIYDKNYTRNKLYLLYIILIKLQWLSSYICLKIKYTKTHLTNSFLISKLPQYATHGRKTSRSLPDIQNTTKHGQYPANPICFRLVFNEKNTEAI